MGALAGATRATRCSACVRRATSYSYGRAAVGWAVVHRAYGDHVSAAAPVPADQLGGGASVGPARCRSAAEQRDHRSADPHHCDDVTGYPEVGNAHEEQDGCHDRGRESERATDLGPRRTARALRKSDGRCSKPCCESRSVLLPRHRRWRPPRRPHPLPPVPVQRRRCRHPTGWYPRSSGSESRSGLRPRCLPGQI